MIAIARLSVNYGSAPDFSPGRCPNGPEKSFDLFRTIAYSKIQAKLVKSFEIQYLENTVITP